MKTWITVLLLSIASLCRAQESKIILDAVNHARHGLGLPDLVLNTRHQQVSDSILYGMIDYYSFNGEVDGFTYDENWNDGMFIYEADDIGYIEEHLRSSEDFRSYIQEVPGYKTIGVSVTCEPEICMTILSFYY